MQVLGSLEVEHHFVGVGEGDALLAAEVKKRLVFLALLSLQLSSLLRIGGVDVADQRIGWVVGKDHLAVQLLVRQILILRIVVLDCDMLSRLQIRLLLSRLRTIDQDLLLWW